MTRKKQILLEVQKRFLNYKPHISLKINAFIDGAEWADKTMIDKACRWLDQQLFIKYDSDAVTRFINDFRKAMEE